MKRWLLLLTLALLIAAGFYAYHSYREKEDHRHALVLYGNVDVRQVEISFRVSGRVVDMPFEEGDWITPGALMATLDPQPYLDQVQQAKAQVSSSQIALKNAEQLLQRRQGLISGGGISLEDYENTLTTRDTSKANYKQAQASLGIAKTNLNDTQVFAPTVGSILTRIREPGSVVKAGDPVYNLSISSPVWIRAYVSEVDLGLIYPGMEAEIYTDTPRAPVYKGHIGFISPVAEFTPKTVETTQLRTDLVYRLRITADSPDLGLRQGMPVTVKLPLSPPESKPQSAR